MDPDRQQEALGRALPLRPRDFFVLVVLAAGDLHGYGIMKEVERESRGSVRLEVGSLYRTLDRLLNARLIAEAGGTGAPPPSAPTAPSAGSERRRCYRLTSFGRRVARAEAERLREVLRLAAVKSLLEGAGETP
ncbi:MAG TPA: helix-turn-helix transcriptional regulator [Thermoanaerobaculia bacterium]|nr:helix-turn-helix transcriptional regulator [Thermoanaerobaculia bacterium]